MEETCRDCQLYDQGVCVILRQHKDPMDKACDNFILEDVFCLEESKD